MIRLAFPWALYVTSNRRTTVRTRGGKPVPVATAQYRERKRATRMMAQNQVSGEGFGTDPVSALILVRFPDRRRRDVTNVPKMFLDALEGVAYDDDCQVKDARVAELPPGGGEPGVWVELREFDPEEVDRLRARWD